ncbi:MAG: phosphomannomutase/phosphoglucomutase [Gammaproteobacteria bacterium]|nr:phosphomannomutase/phosphoglucomutase [Gammaproteobacteria bacterium]
MTPPPASIFLPYDIRGVVGAGLDAAAAYQIGRAIGSEAAARNVAAIASGRDARPSSAALQRALNEGLLAAGIEVLAVGCVPTPLLYYAACSRCAGSGVMVTGSHNPPQYNGIKVMLGEESLHGEAITALHRRIVAGDLCEGAGRLRRAAPRAAYLDEMAGRITLQRPLRVVVDCGNGMAAQTAPALLQRLGCEVLPLYCEVDGTFPNHHPDPNRPENLRELQQAVVSQGAELGLAFDGDGDRLGVVSADGEIIWPDRLLMLLARDLLSRHPGAEVIYDVKCSRHLGEVISQAGGEPSMWRTGHSMLKARMRERGALLAGEMSGHLLLKEGWYGFDDALFAAARLLQILSRAAHSRTLLEALPVALSTPELHLPLSGDEHHRLMVRLLARADFFSDATLTTLDGLRVEYADGWGLVRASNTSPTLVLRFEADTAAALARIERRFRELLLELEPTLNLPF